MGAKDWLFLALVVLLFMGAAKYVKEKKPKHFYIDPVCNCWRED